jgi:hypothetical protein
MPTRIGRGSSTAPCSELLGRGQAHVSGRKKFRFKNKLVSLDSTVIDLCATLFDWAKSRRTKEGRSSCIACWTDMSSATAARGCESG